MLRNRATTNRTSFSEKVVTGLAIAVILGGFAAGGYASSTIDGQSGGPFGTRVPSYRPSIHTHRTGSRLVRHKNATASAPSASLTNYPLDTDAQDLSIESSAANLAAEYPDTLLMGDVAARVDRRDASSVESPKMVPPLPQSLRSEKTRQCGEVLRLAGHLLNCPKRAHGIAETYAK
jgi:hypothetical protein